MRLGRPVVPPLSKTWKSQPSREIPAGTRASTETFRHSSLTSGNSSRSAQLWMSVSGSKSSSAARFTQYGDPVAGEKCHCIAAWMKSSAGRAAVNGSAVLSSTELPPGSGSDGGERGRRHRRQRPADGLDDRLEPAHQCRELLPAEGL